MADRSNVVERTAAYVRDTLYADTSGHDWWHVARVRYLAVAIGEREGGDLHIIELAALLHDISDYKLNGGDSERGPTIAGRLLADLGEPSTVCATVADVIREISFEGGGAFQKPSTLEGQVVQDADRLDALGAIGIGRAFAYGGHAAQPMHDPDIEPVLHESKAAYRNRKSTTINHFYEKLLLLRDRMNTQVGREIADRRHAVMTTFLNEFLEEWTAKDAVEHLGD